jgi:hypothetical protein
MNYVSHTDPAYKHALERAKGNDPTAIPDQNTQFLAVLESMRCTDCGGFTTPVSHLNIAGVGVGQFCSCPFDVDHP